MRPSSIAPNPVEFREAPPNSTVTLTSQRHAEKLPEVTGTSRVHSDVYIFPFLLCLSLLFFSQLFRKAYLAPKTILHPLFGKQCKQSCN